MYNTIYRRNLPHWHPEGAAIFLTWRLFDSLPAFVRNSTLNHDSPGKRFALLDSTLDRAEQGPCWLKNPKIAKCVTQAIHYGAVTLDFYALHAFVVMPNHVHILIAPKVTMSRITNGLKGVTARRANCILARQGNHFWQDESFDHWVRNAHEFSRIKQYIERNPVSAGLVNQPEHWPWSSAVPTEAGGTGSASQ